MKALFSVIFLLSLTTFAMAKEPCPGQCKRSLEGMPDTQEIDSLAKSSKQYAKYVPNKEKLRSLAANICSKYGLRGNQIASGVKTLVKNYMIKHAGYKTTENKDIVRFLNENKDYMTCGKEKKNYMMVAFDNGAHNELFRRLFAKDLYEKTDKKNTKVDINAVSLTGPNGTPETVLDYIDKVISTSKTRGAFISEVKRVKSMFTKHFGAKKFSQLDPKTQSQYKLMLAGR